MDLLKRQQNQEGQTKNYMVEYYKFVNNFRFFEDDDLRSYFLSLLRKM